MRADTPLPVAEIEKSTKRQHFTDVRHVTVRWEPYKPDGARQMKAIGRWQEQVGSGDYWRWQNCERPAFAHEPDMAEQLTEARAEIERLREDMALAIKAIEECRDEIDQCIRNEYPHDHPVQERYRKRDFAANPARIFLDARAALQEGKSDD